MLLGAPFLSVRWGFPDDRVLPNSASAHQVGDQLRRDFVNNSDAAVTVVVPDTNGVSASDIDRYAADLSRVPDVSAVSAPTGTFVDGNRIGPPSAPAGQIPGSAFLTVDSSAPLFSDQSEAQLDRLHAVRGPAGRHVDMTGTAQTNRDSVDAIGTRLPVVLGLIAVIMFVLLFLLTGSIVMPLKALVLNILSLTAAFGAMVWIFQDGHLGALGTTPTGTLVANMPVLLFCIAFGLSMDYEVFLVSRIREFWLASGRDAGRQRRERGPWHRPHRTDHHRRRAHHVDLLRRVDRRPCVGHANVRPWPDAGGPGRRDAGADGAGARVHARYGPMELVGTPVVGRGAPTSRFQRRPPACGAGTHTAGRSNRPAPGLVSSK